MPGGIGETDIYYCEKNEMGWGSPINLGPEINTSYGENFPSLDSKGNLYFSSEGYFGYGGMDLCVSKQVNGQFQQAKPLKAPINSSYDDFINGELANEVLPTLSNYEQKQIKDYFDPLINKLVEDEVATKEVLNQLFKLATEDTVADLLKSLNHH